MHQNRHGGGVVGAQQTVGGDPRECHGTVIQSEGGGCHEEVVGGHGAHVPTGLFLRQRKHVRSVPTFGKGQVPVCGSG